MDSLGSVELRNSLASQFDVQLPATLAFDYPTAAAVADFISQTLAPTTFSAADLITTEDLFAVHSAQNVILHTEILGVGCLYPHADSVSAFWNFTEKAGTAQSVVPLQRWDVDHWYSPEISKPALSYSRFAAFVSGIDLFDGAAFRMGRAEATALDPQTRVLLEVTGEALSEAGSSSGSSLLSTSSTGTFVGCMFTDYMDFLRVSLKMNHTGPVMTGNGAPYQSGRVAYAFGFQGPCIGIDTACSSSLVATHAAHRAVIGGEASAAVAAGINGMLWHETTVGICQLQALSPVGRCKSFDSSADGYGRGEGFASIFLAQAGIGAHPHGVIFGGAVNQDGRSSSLTSPHGPSQQMLLNTCLKMCSLAPARVDNVAVHGTGTALGDPIEVGAISAALGVERSQPLTLTSVKSCYGHTEGTAGVTGLLFALNFAANAAKAPPIMSLRSMNPYVASAIDQFGNNTSGGGGSGAFLPRQLCGGSASSSSQTISGTSSFGMSGVNAHVMISKDLSTDIVSVSSQSIRMAWERQRYWPVSIVSPLFVGVGAPALLMHRGGRKELHVTAMPPHATASMRDHFVRGMFQVCRGFIKKRKI